MTKTLLLAGAAALALSGNAYAAKAPSTGVKAKPSRHFSALPGSVVLYSQSSALSNAISSQNFTSGTFTAYNDAAADDFVVPAGVTWKVKEVDVRYVQFGSHDSTSMDVIFYNDGGGVPGTAAATCLGRDTGGYNIKLGKPKATKCKVKLKSGTYWVSVVANQNFSTDSQWYWAGHQPITGFNAQWQNPGGGFGICPTWCDASNVFGYSADLSFTIKGSHKP